MKGKLIILCGISNSGKSTFAAKTAQHNPERYVITNRDKIRELLYGYTEQSISEYYHRNDIHKLEKQVTKYEDSLIYEGLEDGKTVIVDATHLTRAYLERFKYWNVETSIEVFPITLKEALIRNTARNRKVDEGIIKKQYNKFVSLQSSLKKEPIDFTPVVLNSKDKGECYVFDIDGCLADNCGLRSPFDWAKVGQDKPIESIVKILNELNYQNEWNIFTPMYICSGRDEVCREETIKWFKDNIYDSEHFTFMLRSKGDNRPDWIVKQEMAQKICKTNTITAWFDDRLQVTRHLRMLGIKVLNVEHNNF